jgi:hypothetical protein
MCVDVYRDVAVLRVHDAGRDVSRVRARSAEESVDDLTGSGLGLLLVGELASAWSVRPTAIGKEVIVVLALDAGGLSKGDARADIPAVRPPLTTEFHQLDDGHEEFHGRQSPEV